MQPFDFASTKCNGIEDKPEALETADPQKGLPMKKEKAGGSAVPETKAAKAGREKDQRRA